MATLKRTNKGGPDADKSSAVHRSINETDLVDCNGLN
jgi:hypothetical protein